MDTEPFSAISLTTEPYFEHLALFEAQTCIEKLKAHKVGDQNGSYILELTLSIQSECEQLLSLSQENNERLKEQVEWQG
jgi:hypothetical protein